MTETATVKRKRGRPRKHPRPDDKPNGVTTTQRFLAKDLEPDKPPAEIVDLVTTIVQAKLQRSKMTARIKEASETLVGEIKAARKDKRIGRAPVNVPVDADIYAVDLEVKTKPSVVKQKQPQET